MRMTLRNLICVLIRDNAVPILFDLNYAQTDGYGGTVRVLDYGILKIGRKISLREGLEPTIPVIRALLLPTTRGVMVLPIFISLKTNKIKSQLEIFEASEARTGQQITLYKNITVASNVRQHDHY